MNPVQTTALKNFDNLPGSAGVRLPVVAAIFGVSTPTVWRWSASGLLPKPTKLGGVTTWPVAELRGVMKSRGVSAHSAA